MIIAHVYQKYEVGMRILQIAIILFVSNLVVAQDNNVKVNVTSIALANTINVSYERAILKKLNKKSTAQVGLAITQGYESDDQEITGWAFTADFRRYLFKIDEFNGLYISPYVRYQSLKLTRVGGGLEHKVNRQEFGAVLGRQFIWHELIALDVFAGPSLSNATLKPFNESPDISRLEGVRIRAGISLGVIF